MNLNALQRPKDSDLVTVCLVPFGSWQGHPMGAETYGEAEGAAMVQYFEATYGKAGKPMPIDYGHESLHKSDAVAAGWCWSAEVAEYPDENGEPVAGVWGKVEWTDRAKAGIESKEYSGAISPVIDMNFPDPVTGQTIPIGLFNAALTNMPFMLDKMPLAPANMMTFHNGRTYLFSRHNHGGTMDPKQMLADAAAALGLPATAGGDEVLGLVKKLVEFVGMLPGAPASPTAMPEPAEAAEVYTAQAANSKILTDVASLLNTEAKDVLARVGELTAVNSAAPTRAEFDAIKKELAERKADELIEANARKIDPERRAFWKERAVKDYADTVLVLAEMKEVLPSNKQTPAQKTNASDIPDDVVKHYRDALGTHAIHAKNKEAK